jgi:hypothetical protein
MSYYSLKPQDPIPADATAEQLAEWHTNLSASLCMLEKEKKEASFISKAFGKLDYLICRHQHELKKIRAAIAERSFSAIGLDLSQIKGISYAA